MAVEIAVCPRCRQLGIPLDRAGKAAYPGKLIVAGGEIQIRKDRGYIAWAGTSGEVVVNVRCGCPEPLSVASWSAVWRQGLALTKTVDESELRSFR